MSPERGWRGVAGRNVVVCVLMAVGVVLAVPGCGKRAGAGSRVEGARSSASPGLAEETPGAAEEPDEGAAAEGREGDAAVGPHEEDRLGDPEEDEGH